MHATTTEISAAVQEAFTRTNTGKALLVDRVILQLLSDRAQLLAFNGCRPEVIAFAIAMERRLQAKDQDKVASWKHKAPKDLAVDLVSKAMTLDRACLQLPRIAGGDPVQGAFEAVLKHAVDAGNIAMFIADVAGVLPIEDLQLPKAEVPA